MIKISLPAQKAIQVLRAQGEILQPSLLRCLHMNAIFSRRGNIKQYIINKLKNVVTKASLGHNQ